MRLVTRALQDSLEGLKFEFEYEGVRTLMRSRIGFQVKVHVVGPARLVLDVEEAVRQEIAWQAAQ